MTDYPKELISAFQKCRESEWADKEYIIYAKEAKKYLKNKADSPINYCRLVVELASYSNKGKKDEPSNDTGISNDDKTGSEPKIVEQNNIQTK